MRHHDEAEFLVRLSAGLLGGRDGHDDGACHRQSLQGFHLNLPFAGGATTIAASSASLGSHQINTIYFASMQGIFIKNWYFLYHLSDCVM
jgi:hypothetical protein